MEINDLLKFYSARALMRNGYPLKQYFELGFKDKELSERDIFYEISRYVTLLVFDSLGPNPHMKRLSAAKGEEQAQILHNADSWLAKTLTVYFAHKKNRDYE